MPGARAAIKLTFGRPVRARLDRFKLTSKRFIRESLLADPRIAQAVRTHASSNDVSEDTAWANVRGYIEEIVPYFNVLMYYEVGYAASRILLNFFYRVTVEHADPEGIRRLPKDSIVVYVCNHRSNVDYVLAGYALAGHVSISYAVGEWARVFPLEYLFKTFGAYFIRRRFREPLYHAVLERYVQLITRNGVTQGIFPEGGLTRDGLMREPRIGLLDYMLGVAREPGVAGRMYIVPVAMNYDRVLEDRNLLRELHAPNQRSTKGRIRTAFGILTYVLWGAGRLVARRWKRFGRAAVTIGEPVPLNDWITARDAEGRTVLDVPREERLARVRTLAHMVMKAVGRLIPVTPVPLACAALQSFPADFVARDALLARMQEMRNALAEVNARVVRTERDIGEVFDRAYRMLHMRRVLVRTGDGYLVLPNGRELISYYANSIAHLLGEFTESVQAHDTLPTATFVD